jgi:hypothetical protein
MGNDLDIDPIDYWTRECCWPREYFKESGEMGHLFARRESTTSLQRNDRMLALALPGRLHQATRGPERRRILLIKAHGTG